MNSLEETLLKAQSANMHQQREAEAQLDSFRKSDPPVFLVQLTDILTNEGAQPLARELAGLMIKNALKNSTVEPYLEGLWQRVNPEVKSGIRMRVLAVLASPEKNIRNSASLAIASIIGLDMAQAEWSEVLQILITNASNVNPDFKEASIVTLGYACEEIPENSISQDSINKLLTPIVGCLNSDESNINILIVAIKALRNSLKLIKANMKSPIERKIIVETAANCSQHTNEQVQLEALIMLCDIAYYYHEHIHTELNILGTVTFNCIKSYNQANALKALEFWTIIADNERDLIENGLPPKGYINIAYNDLIGFALQKINDYDEQCDEWNLHKSCATIISLLAQIIQDPIVDLVGPFIASEIISSDWKNKETALLILGMIIEGPSSDKLAGYITNGIPTFLVLLKDHSKQVRQTAVWMISRICELHFDIVSSVSTKILQGLLESLEDSNMVACHACWGIICILDSLQTDQMPLSREQLNHIIGKLIEVAHRHGAVDSEHNLQIAAYGAISSVFECIPKENTSFVAEKIPIFVNLLKQTYHIQQPECLQSLICSVLQCTFSRVQCNALSDRLIKDFVITVFRIFDIRNVVIEEGLQALGVLAQNIGCRFSIHMDNVFGYLLFALKSTKDMALLRTGTMVVGDFARSLKAKFGLYLAQIIPLILEILINENVSSRVKVSSIESLADLAMHCKQHFILHVPSVLSIIESAARASTQFVSEEDNPDLYEYLEDLRDAILVFYIGLIQGLDKVQQQSVLINTIHKIIEYTLFIVQDQFRPKRDIQISAIGLLGDIATVYREHTKSALSAPGVMNYLYASRKSNDVDISDAATFSLEQISSS